MPNTLSHKNKTKQNMQTDVILNLAKMHCGDLTWAVISECCNDDIFL